MTCALKPAVTAAAAYKLLLTAKMRISVAGRPRKKNCTSEKSENATKTIIQRGEAKTAVVYGIHYMAAAFARACVEMCQTTLRHHIRLQTK